MNEFPTLLQYIGGLTAFLFLSAVLLALYHAGRRAIHGRRPRRYVTAQRAGRGAQR
ncbi:MAG TPA: hypothetical protein PK829_15555 [Promineifilum sp.]|nr:hypothetical protein [Promineifilum sp.]